MKKLAMRATSDVSVALRSEGLCLYHLSIGSISALCRLYIGSTSALYRLYVGSPSALCRLSIGSMSTLHRLYIGSMSTLHRLYIGSPSALYRLYIGTMSTLHGLYVDSISARVMKKFAMACDVRRLSRWHISHLLLVIAGLQSIIYMLVVVGYLSC